MVARQSAFTVKATRCLSGLGFVQSGARGMLARSRARHLRQQKAALRIQTAWRMALQRFKFLQTRQAITIIQSAWRGHTARSVALERRHVSYAGSQYRGFCIQTRPISTYKPHSNARNRRVLHLENRMFLLFCPSSLVSGIPMPSKVVSTTLLFNPDSRWCFPSNCLLFLLLPLSELQLKT